MVNLVAGFVLSLIGSLPPGLISLTVSQTSISRGAAAALAVATGAAAAEFFQAWAAVVFTNWFIGHPSAERVFHWAAVPVFVLIGLYLVFFAKPPQLPNHAAPVSLHRPFAKGVVVSVFNLLAIPYWFVYCGWLRVEGWWQEGLLPTLLFASGVSIGTIFALSLYAWLGQCVLQRSATVAKQANLVIGLIFLGLGIKVFWGLMF